MIARGGLCLAALLLLLSPSAARAQSPAPDRAPPAAPAAPAKPAAPPPVAPKPDDERTQTARRHFKNGVKLFQDKNYKGALAEFEAAYELKPGASSLQNIALSLKALFRYAEAARKLDLLLARHGTELSEDDRRAVREAIDELSQLVGSIALRVEPADARVTIDGRSVTAAERAMGARLDVGEHTIAAEAAGYERLVQVVRISGGNARLPVDLVLRPVGGFINVVTGDPDAAIAVDGTARAFQSWRGPVPPGRHYVQVYKRGFTTFERAVVVELGRTVDVRATLGPPLPPGEIQVAKSAPDPAPIKREQRGWYALAALCGMGIDEAPQDLDVKNAETTAAGAFGVRAGYRLWTPIAIEVMIDASRHEVKDACARPCNDTSARLQYNLDTFHAGGNLRIMSSGERFRFSSVAGVGGVRHKVEIEPGAGDEGWTASGVDPYFFLELGVQANFAHLLAEIDALLFVDGVTNVKKSAAAEARTGAGDVFADGGLRMLGLGLRLGWSEWKPGN
jgi:hypothetical protein